MCRYCSLFSRAIGCTVDCCGRCRPIVLIIIIINIININNINNINNSSSSIHPRFL